MKSSIWRHLGPIATLILIVCVAGNAAPKQKTHSGGPKLEGKTAMDSRQAPTALPAGKLPWRPYVLSPQSSGYVIENVWPTIFYGEEVVPEVRRKVSTLPWAKHAFNLMKQEAELTMAEPPQLPMEPAGWRHDFYSRTTAEHLVFDPNSGDRYLDPSTGKYERDDAQRAAWVLLVHERTYRMMRSIGMLYQITGDERYAKWVAQGMRTASVYFTHREFQKSGALYYQPLYDAAMLALLGNAYELTRKSPAYSAEDHQRIRELIFEERMPSMIDFLKKHPTHNMSCYVAAALAIGGKLYDKPEWEKLGVGPSSGLKTQLMNGLRADAEGKVDGLWYEGTFFYHFYSLCPLISLWEADRRANGQLSHDPMLRQRFQAMFSAPISLVDPQLRLPLVGDLGAPRLMNLAGYRHVYEYAAGKIDPAKYSPVLAEIYRLSGAPRVDLEALAFGPDSLPAAGGIPEKDTRLPVAGMGVFRSKTPIPMYLTFRCGSYVGGHDHPDRLNIALNAFGEPISPDLGTPGYSLHAKNGYYFRSTISHNTLFVDEGEQTGNATLEWRDGENPACARGTIVDKSGVRFQRTVFFDAPRVVLVDEYSADSEHRFGWAFHAYGPISVPGLDLSSEAHPAFGMPALPVTKSYSQLTERRSAVAPRMLEATWQVSPKIRLKLITTSDSPFEVTIAKTPGQPLTDRMSAVILRAPGKSRRFVSILEPYTSACTVRDVSISGADVVVTGADGISKTYRWTETPQKP